MPFTPSHTVFALAFVRTPLVPSAVAIGAITPDLPLFVRGVGLHYGFTHNPVNVVWTTLMALVLFLVWRVLMRPAVAEFAPDAARRRLPDSWREVGPQALKGALIGARDYPFLLALSAMLGVLSHIYWDEFTHEGRWGSELLPALNDQWGPLTGIKWLQHGSSVIGLLGVGVWMVFWLRRKAPGAVPARLLPRWVGVGIVAALPVMLVAALIWGYGALGPFTVEFTPQHLAYAVLPPTCGFWGLLAIAGSVAVVARSAGRDAHQAG